MCYAGVGRGDFTLLVTATMSTMSQPMIVPLYRELANRTAALMARLVRD